MGAIRTLSATVLGVTALTLTGCTSTGGGDDDSNAAFAYNLQPEKVSPGGRLALPVQGCKDDATVYSGVFDTVTIPKGRTTATATVDRGARPGSTYNVTFRCGQEYGHRRLAIAASSEDNDANGDGYRKTGGGNGGGYNGNGIGNGYG
ncbi:hypothetical protein, partial [Streptomyces sp. NPDC047009]|uniref:hypothetical protein n=1 Tax=Streptomyces sp. NPDC047009 TaxID=3154496 RepID=UPI0033E6DE43